MRQAVIWITIYLLIGAVIAGMCMGGRRARSLRGATAPGRYVRHLTWISSDLVHSVGRKEAVDPEWPISDR